MAWSTCPRSTAQPGKILNLTADDRAEPRRRRAVLSGDLLVLDDPACRTRAVPRHRCRTATASRITSRPRSSGSTSSRPMAAAIATRSATTRRATFPTRSANSTPRSKPGRGGCQSGPAGTTWSTSSRRCMTPDGGHLAALADWTDRIKAGELPSATPAAAGRRRAQPRRHGARLARPKALSA